MGDTKRTLELDAVIIIDILINLLLKERLVKLQIGLILKGRLGVRASSLGIV